MTQGVDNMPQRGGDHGRRQQQVDQNVVKVQQEPQPGAALRRFGRVIRTVCLEASVGLNLSEPTRRYAGLIQRCLASQHMPWAGYLLV